MADVALRVEHLEGWVDDHKAKTEEIEERLDLHSKGIDRLLSWGLEGNGDSAEVRLKAAEIHGDSMEAEMTTLKACVEQAVSPAAISKIAAEGAQAVVTNARKHDRTLAARLNAVGKIMIGAAAILGSSAALAQAFLR
ncbi:MAG: hypothetical protein NTU91_02650 [Chloroflexi bacterium]|nr:hypothetical protein [Chloroflexota bacterium]